MLFRIIFFITIVSFISCKKETASLQSESFSDYQPLRANSVFIYHLDSFVTKPNASTFEKHSYHLKDSIESSFTDNSGLTNFRVYRYTRDTLDKQEWKFANAYTWTINTDKLEMTENNLRFIKLASPVSASVVWLGNAYIDTKSPNSEYTFLNNWQYGYENLHTNFSVRKGVIPNTITVLQADETDPNVPFSPSLDFHEHNHSAEVYAKNIGLIYKEYFHWTWQKNPNPGFQHNSYGITLNLIDYKIN